MQGGSTDYFTPKVPLTQEERIIFYLTNNDPEKAEALWDIRYTTIIKAYYLKMVDRLNEMQQNLTQIKEMKKR